MNHGGITHSHRLASRRLHRRSGQTAAAAMQACAMIHASMPQPMARTVLGLSETAVREAGMLELLAAELRITELEKALEKALGESCADPLTGALNRRGFDRAYERERARIRRSGKPLALVMIDLDDFKLLNDRYGHLAGDRVLVHLVNRLSASLRPSDVLCRLGGEEFVMLLPETGVEDARSVVCRLLAGFSSCAIPEVGQVVTFSAGVVAHDGNDDLEDAIARADAAAYAAKRAGKNRVVVA